MIMGSIDYSVKLSCPKGTAYSGSVTMDMTIYWLDTLVIDSQGQNIQSLRVNDHRIPVEHNGYFLRVDQKYLREGENRIVIEFSNNYATDGEGFHSFTDTDGKQYLYSHCEPAYARKFLPCLDQPDLKGTMSL